MLVTIASSVWAEDYKSKRLLLSELTSGQKVIIEAASTPSNYGYYIKAVGNYFAWKQGLDRDCIWVLVHSDKTRYGETDTYFFQHLNSGKYMGGGDVRELTNASPMLADDIEHATPIKLYGMDKPFKWTEYRNPTSNPRGWDDNSITMRGFDDERADWWYANDVLYRDGGYFPNSTATYNFQWNFYSAEFPRDGIFSFQTTSDSTVVIMGFAEEEYAPNLVIPDTVVYEGKKYKVVEISAHAFDGCNALNSVEISANVTTIGERAFAGCDNIAEIIFTTDEPFGISANVFSCQKKATLKVREKFVQVFGRFDGWRDFYYIEAYQFPVKSILLNMHEQTLYTGETFPLSTTFMPLEAYNKNISYVSSNPAVASVDATGLVTALKAGETYITVISEENPMKKDSCLLTIKQHVTGLEFKKPSLMLKNVGDRETLTVDVLPEDATDKTVRLVSTNPSVAEVSEEGIVTAIGEGKCFIVALSSIKDVVAACVVNVGTNRDNVDVNKDEKVNTADVVAIYEYIIHGGGDTESPKFLHNNYLQNDTDK